MSGAWELSTDDALHPQLPPRGTARGPLRTWEMQYHWIELAIHWTSRAALRLEPLYAYANISIKFYLAMYQIGSLFWFTKTSHVWSLMCWSSLPLANKSKIIPPAYSGRLSFVPGKPAAAEYWLCRADISVSRAKASLVGMGSISIHCNGTVWSWCKSTKWLTEIERKMVREVSSSFGSSGKHCRMV